MAASRRWPRRASLALLLIAIFGAGWLTARTGMGAAWDRSQLPEVERAFSERMRGAALVGHFTTFGREDRTPTADRYDIYSVDKVGADQWRFNTKIGEYGVTLPIVVRMTFADDTPIILMTNAAIPGLGTFTARVFFHGEHYAGTWQHSGRGGGHMFGRIERGEAVQN